MPGFAGAIVISAMVFLSSYTTLAGALPATILQNTQFFIVVHPRARRLDKRDSCLGDNLIPLGLGGKRAYMGPKRRAGNFARLQS
jgi:hypothetical protein